MHWVRSKPPWQVERAKPKRCACGCGRAIRRGLRRRYATGACQTRAWKRRGGACGCEALPPTCARPGCGKTVKKHHAYCSDACGEAARETKKDLWFCACGCGKVLALGAPLRARFASSACRLRYHRRSVGNVSDVDTAKRNV